MQNLNDNTCSAYETSLKYKQSKERRNKKKEYDKLKNNVYTVSGIVAVLALLMTTSVIVASALLVKNTMLTGQISQQTETYQKAVAHYETLNAKTADNAVNDFVDELTSGILSTDPNSLTKSKLKSFITEVEEYVMNFDALGLSNTHPYIYEELLTKLNDAMYALENETYMYPYSDRDYVLMCNLVKREQGDNVSDDEAQCLVACVALNRRNNGPLYAKDAKDPQNPTLLEVITQKGQYGPNYSYNMTLDNIPEKVQENVRKVFEHEYEAPGNVMFQTGIYYNNKKLYKKFWNPAPYNNYTYFYFGKTI